MCPKRRDDDPFLFLPPTCHFKLGPGGESCWDTADKGNILRIAEQQPEGTWVPGLHGAELPYLDLLLTVYYVSETNFHIADETIS